MATVPIPSLDEIIALAMGQQPAQTGAPPPMLGMPLAPRRRERQPTAMERAYPRSFGIQPDAPPVAPSPAPPAPMTLMGDTVQREEPPAGPSPAEFSADLNRMARAPADGGWRTAVAPAIGPFETTVAPAGPDADAIMTGATNAAAARPPVAAMGDGLPQPTLLDRAGAFVAGLSGTGALNSYRAAADRETSRNATYDALIGRGVSPDMARAMVLDPNMMKVAAPQIFSPQTAVVNDRLVDKRTGQVILDLSDPWRPVTGNAAGVMNQATGEVRQIEGLPRPKPRHMTVSDIGKLRNEGSILNNLNQLQGTFSDDYAVPLVGGVRTWVGRNMPEWASAPDARRAAQWWQEYDRAVGIIERHELFGSALTPTEQRAWYAADIQPGMNAETIKANLATRRRILAAGMQRYARALASAGYDPTTISNAFGVSPAELGIGPGGAAPVGADTVAPSTAGGVGVDIPERPASVPEGSAYSPSRQLWRGPDGRMFDRSGNPAGAQ